MPLSNMPPAPNIESGLWKIITGGIIAAIGGIAPLIYGGRKDRQKKKQKEIIDTETRFIKLETNLATTHLLLGELKSEIHAGFSALNERFDNHIDRKEQP